MTYSTGPERSNNVSKPNKIATEIKILLQKRLLNSFETDNKMKNKRTQVCQLDTYIGEFIFV